jgi:hypothetical protein
MSPLMLCGGKSQPCSTWMSPLMLCGGKSQPCSTWLRPLMLCERRASPVQPGWDLWCYVREGPALFYLDETSDVMWEKSQPCSTWMRPLMLCERRASLCLTSWQEAESDWSSSWSAASWNTQTESELHFCYSSCSVTKVYQEKVLKFEKIEDNIFKWPCLQQSVQFADIQDNGIFRLTLML